MKSVYSAVRTRSLNKAVCASSLELLNDKRTHMLLRDHFNNITKPTGHVMHHQFNIQQP